MHNSAKILNVAIALCLWEWSSIIFDARHMESCEDLKDDAQLLLEGSRGRIGLIILVKLLTIDIETGEQEVRDGFLCFRQRNWSQHLRYCLRIIRDTIHRSITVYRTRIFWCFFSSTMDNRFGMK